MRTLWCALGLVIAASCGDNIEPPYDPWLLEDLTPAQGLSIRTPEFDVPQGVELQDCYFFDVPATGGELVTDRIKLALNPGSHHMNLFRVKTIVGLDPAAGVPVDMGGIPGVVIHGATNQACWKSANWADWPLVTNSQQSAIGEEILDWKLPANVATHLAPGEKLMLQVHYVNASEQVTPFTGRAGRQLLPVHGWRYPGARDAVRHPAEHPRVPVEPEADVQGHVLDARREPHRGRRERPLPRPRPPVPDLGLGRDLHHAAR